MTRTLMLLLLLTWVPARAQEPLTVYCNNTPVQVTPVIRNGATYYPVDDIVRALGARVYWNPTDKTYKINDNAVGIEPLYLGGHFYLPLEAIAQATSSAVTWDLAHSQVVLKTRADQTPQKGQQSTPSNPAKTTPNPPWDASMDGRLPNGWQFPNPSLPAAQPDATPGRHLPSQPSDLTQALAKQSKGNHDVFIPRSRQNAAFQLTVSNLEVVGSFKGYYQPRGGHVFTVIYISQKNISGQAQVYPGKLSLQDNQGNNYEALEELSNFWPVIMRPYGINFGYLVFELPETAVPTQLTLTTVSNPPLSVNL